MVIVCMLAMVQTAPKIWAEDDSQILCSGGGSINDDISLRDNTEYRFLFVDNESRSYGGE